MNLFRKKNKTAPQTLHDPVLGNMTFNYRWWREKPFMFRLWGKDYSMDMGINTLSKENPITEAQHKVYLELCLRITEIQKNIEKMLENEFPFLRNCNPANVFKSGSIILSTDGKCGMMIDIEDEYLEEINMEEIGAFLGNSFGVSLLPDTFLVNSVDDFEELFN